MDEVLWIYQRKSNNIHDLKSHIWDEWADEAGSIGKAYGYQIRVIPLPRGDDQAGQGPLRPAQHAHRAASR